jgi:hypothetical protein
MVQACAAAARAAALGALACVALWVHSILGGVAAGAEETTTASGDATVSTDRLFNWCVLDEQRRCALVQPRALVACVTWGAVQLHACGAMRHDRMRPDECTSHTHTLPMWAWAMRRHPILMTLGFGVLMSEALLAYRAPLEAGAARWGCCAPGLILILPAGTTCQAWCCCWLGAAASRPAQGRSVLAT